MDSAAHPLPVGEDPSLMPLPAGEDQPLPAGEDPSLMPNPSQGFTSQQAPFTAGSLHS